MRHHQPSGLRHGLPLLIDPNWSPEQVMAIIELIDDLRERIWAHYESVLLDKFATDHAIRHDVEISDPPF
jgi:hypothetical protein